MDIYVLSQQNRGSNELTRLREARRRLRAIKERKRPVPPKDTIDIYEYTKFNEWCRRRLKSLEENPDNFDSTLASLGLAQIGKW